MCVCFVIHTRSNRARSFSSALFSIREMYEREIPSFFAISNMSEQTNVPFPKNFPKARLLKDLFYAPCYSN